MITREQKKDLSFDLRDVGVVVSRLDETAYTLGVLEPEMLALKQALENARAAVNAIETK